MLNKANAPSFDETLQRILSANSTANSSAAAEQRLPQTIKRMQHS